MDKECVKSCPFCKLQQLNFSKLTLTMPSFLGSVVAKGGGFGPPSDLGRRTRDRDENWHARCLRRTLTECMVTFSKNL